MPETSVRDVVLTSRVRLARNFEEFPFPAMMRGEDGEKAQLCAANALAHTLEGSQYALYRIHDLPYARRRVLVENRIISDKLLSAGQHAAILLKRDETVCLLINGEDHLRIHALLPGNSLYEAARLAFEVDDAIGETVSYAFDAEMGFLTSCPTNTGTGMRASALLHLPSLTRSGSIGAMVRELAKLNISLRPLTGDDGEARAELYIIGNQVALGRSERELLDSIDAVIAEIVDRERAAREILLSRGDSRLDDRLMRSLGIVRYARRLGEAEWMRRWSDVRLAVQAGMLRMDLSVLDALLEKARPAHLEMEANKELSPVERDEARAKLVREALAT